MSERYLTVDETATELGTTVRFMRRLIAQLRIRFVKYGRPVRIPFSAIEEFVAGGMVQPHGPEVR